MAVGRAPALPLALALLVGSILGRWLQSGFLAWAAVGSVVAAVLPRPLRLWALAALMGLAAGQLARPAALETLGVDLERPVGVIGTPETPWRSTALGWSTRLRVETLSQSGTTHRWRADLLLYLPVGGAAPTGRRLAARGWLRPPVRYGNGLTTSASLWRLALSSRRLMTPAGGGTAPEVLWQLWNRPRRAVERRLRHPEHRRAAAISRALILGDASDLPLSWVRSLRRAGLGHVLAVSGLHVGLVVVIVWTGCIWLRPRWRLLPCGLVALLYLAIVGPRPSVVRSTLMAVVAMAALFGGRKPVALNALAVVLCLMVLRSPLVVDRLGFQLTSAATLGLLILAPVLQRQLTRLPGWLSNGLAASGAAHLATLPWSLVVFHLWTPGALLLNLVAVPWLAATLALSVGVVLLSEIPFLGGVLWWALEQAAAPFGWLSMLPVRSVGSQPVALGWPAAVAATALMTAAACWRGSRGARLALLAGAVTIIVGHHRPAKTPEVAMLDVGQGESILLRDGSHGVLVDGGGGRVAGIGARQVVPALRRLGVRRLDGVVMTHPDLDHCGGLLEVVELLPVESLWATPGWNRPCYRQLVARRGLRLRPLWVGRSFRVGEWKIEVLHPPAGSALSGNERSLVLHASHGGFSILLTGDLGAPGERALLGSRAQLKAVDVLKLGHHGSRGSTGPEVLNRTAPTAAIVSSGPNNVYGHPAPETVRRLVERGIRLHRTDLDGQIIIRLDGESGTFRVATPWSTWKRRAPGAPLPTPERLP